MMRTRLRLVGYVLSVAAFTMHFLLTLLYVAPVNPVRLRTVLPDVYVGSFFYQDWGLFAPNPVQGDVLVQYQCVAKSGLQTPVLDAVTGLWNRGYNNGFERVMRTLVTPAMSDLYGERWDAYYVKVCADPEGSAANGSQSQFCEGAQRELENRRQAHLSSLIRVGSAFCADIARTNGVDFDQIRVWLVMSEVPRWSQRGSEPIEAGVFLGTHDLVPTPAFGIWKYRMEAGVTS